MKERYYFTELAAALERVLHADVGLEGLDTLIYGWLHKGHCSRETLRKRQQRDGEKWLTHIEAQSLSEYAQYDLTN